MGVQLPPVALKKMTSPHQKITELLDQEIAFHSEVENPWYWRWICKLFQKRECHKVLVNELRFLKKCLEPKSIRYCGDCGEPFEPEDATDWWCKKHLLKRYDSVRLRPSSELSEKYYRPDESEMTDSGPGGS
jgi:hypothetical protein